MQITGNANAGIEVFVQFLVSVPDKTGGRGYDAEGACPRSHNAGLYRYGQQGQECVPRGITISN